MKILIAEDDLNIREGLRDLLSREGYDVLAVENGRLALDAFKEEKPQFIILDIMMPELDGYAVCREIRSVDNDVPIIFLSAKSEEIDRVIGLELGADDYISKPFGTREVIARIRAVTRRYLKTVSPSPESQVYEFGDLTIYPSELRAKRADQSIDLSLRDLNILSVLKKQQGKVVSRDQLFNQCWVYDHMPNSRTLDQHISKLRKLIEADPAVPKLIKTIRGVGYRYE